MAQGVVDKRERVLARERHQPQRHLREVYRDRVAIDAVSEPANAGLRLSPLRCRVRLRAFLSPAFLRSASPSGCSPAKLERAILKLAEQLLHERSTAA